MIPAGQNKNFSHSRRSIIKLAAGGSAIITTATGLSSAQSSADRINWKFTIDDEWRIRTAPTIIDGIVYFGYGGGTVYAVDAATGEEVWRYDIGASVRSTPQVVAGTVYVGASDNNLYALDADSGDEIWTFSTGERSNRTGVVSSPTVSNGTVFVGNRFLRGTGPDTGVYAIDTETGTEKWSFETGATVEASPLVVNGTVVVGSQDNNVYALDEQTGTEIWSYSTSAAVASPAYSANTVFIGNENGKLFALDINSGENKWTFTSDGTGSVGSKSAPTVKDGSVFVGLTDGTLHSIDETDGTENWNYTATDDSFFTSPTIAGDTIFIRGAGKALYVIHSDGSERWTFNAPGELPDGRVLRSPSSPTVVNGNIYFGGANTLFSLTSDSTKSDGSRVNYGILGHHRVWNERASEGDTDPSEVELRDVVITPNEVDGTNETHTLTFDVANLSADDGKDDFSIAMPTNVKVSNVSIVRSDGLELTPPDPAPSNPIEFSVNPNAGEINNPPVEFEVELHLSPAAN